MKYNHPNVHHRRPVAPLANQQADHPFVIQPHLHERTVALSTKKTSRVALVTPQSAKFVTLARLDFGDHFPREVSHFRDSLNRSKAHLLLDLKARIFDKLRKS